jgi:thermosome
MDKMLVDSMGDVVITNDGATILKEIDVEHPAAKMVVEVAKTLDEECGDGTTSAIIISGELLKQAENLIDQGVHPTIIANGYKMASKKALEILKDISIPVTAKDKNILNDIAMTAMTGKSVGGAKEYLASIAVQAVTAISEEKNGSFIADIDNIKVEKKHGGSVSDSTIIEGIIIDKEPVHPSMPRKLEKAKIALINSALEVKKTEVDAKIQITDPTQLQAFLDEEERMMKGMADKILTSGATMVICQKGIDDFVQYYLAKAGIMAIRRAKKSDMEKLAKATGARIVTTLDEITKGDLGYAGTVEVTKISDDEMTFVTGCKKAKAVSILIRGGTDHVVDEIERAIHDALSVVSITIEDGYAVAGGGAPETELALRLKEYASSVGGREQLAIDAFAYSMEIIPKTLAENAGLDVINSLVNLRSAHEGIKGNKFAGLDATDGKILDMRNQRVVEPLRVKTQGITSATEVATMILRIDDVIASKGGGMPPMPPGGGMPPDMGGMGY